MWRVPGRWVVDKGQEGRCGVLRGHLGSDLAQQLIFATYSIFAFVAGDMVWCGLEDGPLQCLCAGTGVTRETRRGVKDVADDPYSAAQLLDTRGAHTLVVTPTNIRLRTFIIRIAGCGLRSGMRSASPKLVELCDVWSAAAATKSGDINRQRITTCLPLPTVFWTATTTALSGNISAVSHVASCVWIVRLADVSVYVF